MKYFLLLAALSMTITINAQKNKKTKGPDIKTEEAIYRKALDMGDLTVARMAVFQIMTKYPELKNWKDSLLNIYGVMGMSEQCIILGEEILKDKPDDLQTMKIIGASYENLGIATKSIEYFEKVLLKENDLIVRYKLAIAQYSLQRYGEAVNNCITLLNDEKSLTTAVTMNYEKSRQNVAMKAAAYNLIGIISMDTNRPAEAKQAFEEALKIQPDFALAKNNLDVLNSMTVPK